MDIPLLDREHRDLMERLEQLRLRFSPRSPQGQQETAAGPSLMDALADFGEAVRAHFRRTTALMSAIGYDGIASHQAETALLMAEYTELLRAWRSEGASVLDERKARIVREWVLTHILGTDRDFVAVYMRLQGQGRPDARRERSAPLLQP